MALQVFGSWLPVAAPSPTRPSPISNWVAYTPPCFPRQPGPRASCSARASNTEMSAPPPPGKPLFSFGLVSDIQYAPIPDGLSFHGCPRFYRNSLVALQRVVAGWREQGVDFAFHMGDILDGFCPKDESEEALDAVLSRFDQLGQPVYHMLGNHCLYNLPRARLNQKLGIPPTPEGGSYYSFCPHPAYLFVVLDSYDVSLLGWPEGHPLHLLAEQLLNTHNPNQEKNSPEGLVGVARRFVKFGGGISQGQLQWLEQQLQAAAERQQAVIVATHLPCHPATCPPACLLWNYEEVLQLLRRSGVVVATIAGHTHQNGYCCDEAGIHHIVLPSVLETPPGRDAYGWVEVGLEGLRVEGVDTMASLRCRSEAAAAAAAAAAAGRGAAAVAAQGAAGAGEGAGTAAAAAAAAEGEHTWISQGTAQGSSSSSSKARQQEGAPGDAVHLEAVAAVSSSRGQ